MFVVFTLRLNSGSLLGRRSDIMIFELGNLDLVFATSSSIFLVSTAVSYFSMSLHRMWKITTLGLHVGLFSKVTSLIYLSASSIVNFCTLYTYALDPAINLELIYLMFDVPIKRTWALLYKTFVRVFSSEPRSCFPILLGFFLWVDCSFCEVCFCLVLCVCQSLGFSY